MSETLFAMPSTLSGAARVMDLWGVFDDYNTSLTPDEADEVAITLDWLAVGDALRLGLLRHDVESSGQGRLPL